MMFVLTNFPNEISRTFTFLSIVVIRTCALFSWTLAQLPPPPYALCAAGNLAYIVGKSEKSSAKKKNVLC